MLYYQGQGKMLAHKLDEVLSMLSKPQEPEPSGDEIVADIMAKHGLRFKENDTI